MNIHLLNCKVRAFLFLLEFPLEIILSPSNNSTLFHHLDYLYYCMMALCGSGIDSFENQGCIPVDEIITMLLQSLLWLTIKLWCQYVLWSSMISFLAKDWQPVFCFIFFFPVLEEVFLQQISNIPIRDYSLLKLLKSQLDNARETYSADVCQIT